MTAPLTDQQLAAMQARCDREEGLGWRDAGTLLAEVTRLRAESEQRLDEAQRAYIFDTAELKRENDRLRAELEQARATTRQEIAAVITAHCFVHNDTAEHGWITCHCEVADELRRTTSTPAVPCAAEAVHQTGCPAT